MYSLQSDMLSPGTRILYIGQVYLILGTLSFDMKKSRLQIRSDCASPLDPHGQSRTFRCELSWPVGSILTSQTLQSHALVGSPALWERYMFEPGLASLSKNLGPSLHHKVWSTKYR